MGQLSVLLVNAEHDADRSQRHFLFSLQEAGQQLNGYR